MNGFALEPVEPEEEPRARPGMGSHESSRMGKDEWLTPPEMVKALGPFDLDPCAPIVRPWDTAKHHYTILDNGLRKEWFGRVWLNPPYGKETPQWMGRMVQHNRGTALIFGRTDTAMWHRLIFPIATAILFVEGRIRFHHVCGKEGEFTGGAPSTFLAFGREDADILKGSPIPGFYMDLEMCRGTLKVS